MSWLAISDGRHALRRPEAADGCSARLLARGCLLIETLVPPETNSDHVIMKVERHVGWARSLRILLDADRNLRIEHRQDRSTSEVCLRLRSCDRDATLRIAMAWDAPSRAGRLSVENLDTGLVDECDFGNPLPLPLDDVAAWVTDGPHREVDPSVALIAVSDSPGLPTLGAGLVAGTPVQTPTGLCPVDALRPGDLVETGDAGYQPVRLAVTHEWPAAGGFAPVMLRAPYFGLVSDIRLAPGHRIMISGADAEYLFGSDTVLAEARFLALHAGAQNRRRTPTIRYTQLVLDHHVCVNAAGAWCESLYLGDLRARSALLSGLPGRAEAGTTLPVHRQEAGPQLKPYEAMVLVSALCA